MAESLSFSSIVILPLAYRGLAVLDGIDRTMVVTAHAHCAVAVPFRATVFQSDVLQRTDFHAFAAVDALVRRQILFVVGGQTVETRINHMRFQPCRATLGHFRELFFIAQSWEIAF